MYEPLLEPHVLCFIFLGDFYRSRASNILYLSPPLLKVFFPFLLSRLSVTVPPLQAASKVDVFTGDSRHWNFSPSSPSSSSSSFYSSADSCSPVSPCRRFVLFSSVFFVACVSLALSWQDCGAGSAARPACISRVCPRPCLLPSL